MTVCTVDLKDDLEELVQIPIKDPPSCNVEEIVENVVNEIDLSLKTVFLLEKLIISCVGSITNI